jgi:hypothetical protein
MNAVSTLLLATLALPGVAAHAADAPARSYDFRALLDGKPIGEHRFTVSGDAAARKVVSGADFSVRFLGFQAFRYHHRAEEQWAGECLAMLASTTDDDGKPASVRLVKEGDINRIATTAGQKAEPGCLMGYAYWNPALRTQTRLINPQTGKVDSVKVEKVGTGTIAVGGRDVPATDWRITGPESPIDVWVSDEGEWIGLDSMVAKGRHKLSYRLP